MHEESRTPLSGDSGSDQGLTGARFSRDLAFEHSNYERLKEQGRFLYPAGRTSDGVPAFRMHDIELIVLDLDNTVAFPNSPGLETQIHEAVHRAIARELSVSVDEGQRIADYYRLTKGGGEFAFLDSDIYWRLIELSSSGHLPVGQKQIRIQTLWDEYSAIDSSVFFEESPALRAHVQEWRNRAKVVVLTDAAEPVARRTLNALGLDPDRDFDCFRAWQRQDPGPPKRVEPGSAFRSILEEHGVQGRRAVSVGDSPDYDILPAMAAGLNIVHVGPRAIPRITSIHQLVL